MDRAGRQGFSVADQQYLAQAAGALGMTPVLTVVQMAPKPSQQLKRSDPVFRPIQNPGGRQSHSLSASAGLARGGLATRLSMLAGALNNGKPSIARE